MSTYLSEKEQVELLKNWAKKYGVSIIVGILLALLISYGWRYWLGYENTEGQQASVLYEQMMIGQTTQQQAQAETFANQLKTQFPHSAYAALAGLMLADDAVKQNQLDQAITQLQWVRDHVRNSALKQIAVIRLARIKLAENKTDDAMATLSRVYDKAFISEIALVRGDIYLAQNNKSAAKEAYQQALQNLPDNSAIRPLVEMKVNQ